MTNPGIVMSGYLDTRSTDHKDYRKRYVVLDHSSLKMYRKETDRDVAGIIFAEDIRNMTNNTEDPVKYPFAFNVITPQKTYVLSTPSQSKRDEWKVKIKAVIDSHSEEGQAADVKYSTVECFLDRGIRLAGEVGSILKGQLTTKATQKVEEPRGCYYDCSLPVSSVMNLFAEHGWQLVSVFHTQVPHTLDAKPAPCDVIVFSHSTTSCM